MIHPLPLFTSNRPAFNAVQHARLPSNRPSLDVVTFRGKAKSDQKDSVICMDFDDTLINWGEKNRLGIPVGLSANLRTLRKQQAGSYLILNTGRGLTSFSTTLESIRKVDLKDLTMDYLILNNGQQVFRNKRNLPLKTWAKTLTQADQDPFWPKALESVTGWSLETVRATMKAQFLTSGFQAVPPEKDAIPGVQSFLLKDALHGEVRIDLSPDQPVFRIRKLPGASHDWQAQVGQKMADAVLHALQEKGWRVTSQKATLGRKGTLHVETGFIFQPDGVSKATALQFVLKELKGVRAVIPAGDDHYNDTELLLHPYQSKENQPLERFPILSGTNPTLVSGLSKLKETIFAPKGELAEAIKAQLQKIRALAKQNA